MLRTRDFILLFTTIVFLLAGISTTVINRWLAKDNVNFNTEFVVADGSDSTFSASLPPDLNDMRQDNLLAMRSKIAELDWSKPKEIAEPLVMDINNEEVNIPSSTPEITNNSSVINCVNYAEYAGFWDARNLTVEIREGSVVVDRIGDNGLQPLYQLPAGNVPTAVTNCLSSDVIGFAKDGSLIRNDEASLYGIFSAETMVGYALDGFPIYGAGNSKVDQCGGYYDMTGQYRYEVQNSNETIINCFAATPVKFP